MSRGSRLVARLLVWLLLAPLLVLAAAGGAAGENPDNPPDRCFRANDLGQLPTCTWNGTRWYRSYDGDGFGSGAAAGGGPGAGFEALFVLVALCGVGVTVWKVSTARRMARDSGMSTGDATAMTLLTDNGLEATYLASNLREPRIPSDPPTRPVPERLRQLAELRDQGVITAEEHDRRRAAILDAL